MNEQLTEKEIELHKVSQISKLKNGTYTVLRNDSQPYPKMEDVYDVLEIPKTHFLILNVHDEYRRTGAFSFNNGYVKAYHLSVTENKYMDSYDRGNEKIHLSTEGEVPVPSYGEYHDKNVKLGDLKVNLNHGTKGKINKIEDQYFIRMLGCNFNFRDLCKNFNASRDRTIDGFLQVWKSMESTYGFSKSFANRAELNEFLIYLTNGKDYSVLDKTDGISKIMLQVKGFYENLFPRDFLSGVAFKLCAENSKSTISGIKFSTVFNKMFSTVTTQDDFDLLCLRLSQEFEKNNSYYYHCRPFLEGIMNEQPDARDMKKEALKRKSTGAFNKIMDDLDFVKVDEVKYPLTHSAVYSGDIPLGTFFRKNGDNYFVFNDNWELWEEMLTKYPKEALQIAATCSVRTTYEKDIMSYFYFVLHKLPEYLEKHTGKKWTGIPKLVNSSNELEPPKEGANGVAKTRSALTPIVDNEKNTVVIPYVSMKISGYNTQYCYGLDFNVLERGFSYMGNVITHDLEKQLNGRDDYGLMFYTLTGSSTAQGYPTFLIIFEKLEDRTKVHFHRTHPMRSKSGDYNPVHSWTVGCYKWAVGNVNFERIKAQQGDLAFVSIDKFPDGEITKVDSYDSHCFSSPVNFTPYTKKDNRNILGFVQLENDTNLNHLEHKNRTIPKGIYEIRQFKSWEANPKGIWSLRID